MGRAMRIESNIAIPDRKNCGPKRVYKWERLAPGQSTLVSWPSPDLVSAPYMDRKRVVDRVRASLAYYRRSRDAAASFTVRSSTKGIRVWRV